MLQTEWCVITGAPCSGKTAVIHELERRGFHVVHEVARAQIEKQLKKGLMLSQIKANKWEFECCILNEKVRIESGLEVNDTIFFDRGLPDSIAYFKLTGLDWAEPLNQSRLFRYKKVFLFDRLKLLKDEIRLEDEESTIRLSFLIEESYRLLGYDLLSVPVYPIRERADYVLQQL